MFPIPKINCFDRTRGITARVLTNEQRYTSLPCATRIATLPRQTAGNKFKIIMFCFLLLPTLTCALEEDTHSKIYIQSDACIYNYKTGASVFTGNVHVDQGSTHIIADKLTTKSNNQHKIHETIAYGITNLAHYWTLPKVGDPEIHAHAKIIKYYPIDANVTLEQTVKVDQKDNNFQGELIHYNLNNQTITVPASKNGRAVLVYNPDE